MDIVVTVKQVPDPDIPPTHFKVDESAKKVIPPAGVSPDLPDRSFAQGSRVGQPGKFRRAGRGRETAVVHRV